MKKHFICVLFTFAFETTKYITRYYNDWYANGIHASTQTTYLSAVLNVQIIDIFFFF